MDDMTNLFDPDAGAITEELLDTADFLCSLCDTPGEFLTESQQKMLLYLQSVGFPEEWINALMKLVDSMILLGDSMQKTFEDIQKLAAEARREEEAERRTRPPKRTAAAGLSPPQRKYWINYRARDKLPAKGLKTSAIRRKRT